MRTRKLIIATIIMVSTAVIPVATTAAGVHKKDARAVAGYLVRASETGAALNADLMKGGGTDDTASLQTVLDRAATGASVHLVIDGVALVGGLNVHGNTTIECVGGGGLYLKDGSSRAIIRNAHRSRDQVVDERIAIRGCFMNGNRAKQPGPHPEREPYGNNQAADGTFIAGLEFLGVNYLTIENVTLWNIRAFGALIGNGSRMDIRNVTVDHGGPIDADWEYLNTDGLHFKGPLQYITVDSIKLRTGDDGLAFNADDAGTDDLTVHDEFGPYVRHGPILDVTVSNIQLMDSLFGVRFLSSKQRIDRVVINNISGTLNGPRLAIISNYMAPSPGNIGTIEFNNVNVDRSRDAKFVARFLSDNQGARDLHRTSYDEDNGGVATFFNVNCNVESLSIRNFRTKVTDERSIIRIGPRANVQQMTAEITLFDAPLRAVPLELEEGGRIGQLSFSLDWLGKENGVSGIPIAWLGGSIGELRWVNTPPRYVDAQLTAQNSIGVRFSQAVKASRYGDGVRIEVNGAVAGVLSAVRDPARPDSVQYTIDKSIGPKDAVSWSYDAADGLIQNMSGDNLPSVKAKLVSGKTAPTDS